MNEPTPDAETIAKSSPKTIYIVIGGLLVVVLLAVGVVIAAGVGIFVYTGSSGGYEPIPKPPPANTTDTGTFPTSNPKSRNKTEVLVEVLKGRSTVGGFALQNIIPANGNKAFGRSQGEAKAIYTGNGSTVTLVVAEYATRGEASVEFGRMLGRERGRGARILSGPTVTGDAINAVFETDEQKAVAFCNWPTGKAVLCHRIGADSAEALEAFREGLRDRN